MKWIFALIGLLALILTGGCTVGAGYGYGGSVYGEYPYTCYGGVYAGYGYPYPYYYHHHWHPYDRDHYWDRHHWEAGHHWDDEHH